jgi:hypothetical protein
MRSTRFDSPAGRRLPRLSFSLAALAAVGACGDAGNDDTQMTSKEVHEVAGTVQAWPGEAQASCGARLVVTRFDDNVGMRAASETRALITTPQAYRDYFGHAPPAGVQLGREWVVFYSAGRQGGGYHADVSVVGVSGDVLHVVTTLTSPVPPCPPPIPGGSGPGMGGGSAPSVPSAPMTTPTAPASTVAPTAGATAPAMDAPAPAVPPIRPVLLPYVLVKFPAQLTHSVDFQHQDINPGCGVDPAPPLCTSSQQCGRSQRCSTERGDCLPCSRDPRAICPAVCFGVCEPRPIDPPPPTSCAAVLCGPGQTCVVLETYPPQAKCVPITPPDRCTSSATCPKGTRCSTERGDCQGCGAGPGVACPAVCFGVCEPAGGSGVCTGGLLMGGCRSAEDIKVEAARLCASQMLTLTDFAVGNACFAGGFESAKYTCCSPNPPPPPPAQCKVDSDCRLVTGGCGQPPCSCSAQPVNERAPMCPMTAVACLVDPCANLAPACSNGICTVKRALPPPPPPVCEGHYLNGMECKTYDQWKQEASRTCLASNRQLTAISGGARCGMGESFTEVKFECCAR